MFETFSKAGCGGRRYFACSAFRNRKDCSFFQWADDRTSSKALLSQRGSEEEEVVTDCKNLKKRIIAFRALQAVDRAYCQTCGKLLFPDEREAHDNQHSITSNIPDALLGRPTKFLKPLENNKTYAQYLFGRTSIQFIADTVRRLGFTRILCIGTPRIHEEIQVLKNSVAPCLDSLLLDLDQRFEQVWLPEQFCRYNMFNHHFFGKSEEIFNNFIVTNFRKYATNKFLVVIDPPFGGMVEALIATLHKISVKLDTKESVVLCPVIWFFPYFMERRMTESCPSLRMLDYKVDYDNHHLFHKGDKGRKEGSPVRIFTNLPPEQIMLPTEEGYWFCKKCKRYSAQENHHCDECGSCTSKDGKRYRHCSKCGKCVKPSRIHCDVCQLCVLPHHICQQKRLPGCHICGGMDHKRRECPKKVATKVQKGEDTTAKRSKKQKLT